MVNELKHIITKIGELDNDNQRQIARMLEDEINFDSSLENSVHKLDILAKEATEEYKNNETKQKD